MFGHRKAIFSFDYRRRPTTNSDQARAAVPMGRRADLPASALDDREGVIYRPLASVVSNPNKEPIVFCPTYIRNDYMAKGRPTTDPKGDSIRIRINDDMRKRLEKKSFQTGQSISQIIRNLITENLS